MSPIHFQRERHRSGRIGWLRAAVLGANDGILSTASLVVGVAAAETSKGNILLAGVAGMVAGAMSMAAGEYVSVSSQADTEEADLAQERREIAEDRESEVAELAAIYEQRGLDERLSHRVAEQLMQHDPLGAHARDELGISEIVVARPVQAALASAGMFFSGAILPLIAALSAPQAWVIPIVVVASLLALGALGTLAAWAGGAPMTRAAIRVVSWGALAMAVTAGIGRLVGHAV